MKSVEADTRSFPVEVLPFDVVVCGGGMGGVCAAIAAARQGCRTALVQDRPVLGGNASSEVRVHIGGVPAHGWHYDGRETGILEEVRLELAVRDPLNEYNWIDTVLYTFCRREENLSLFLNTTVTGVKREGDLVASVVGVQSGTEKAFEFVGRFFLDATGDGTVGFLAGADFRVGREARSEFGESFAPEEADGCTLGSSILFRAEDIGRPVTYIPPPWACNFTSEDLKHRRGTLKHPNHDKYWHADTSGWWWVELGGDGDTIGDNEEIRFALQSVVFGLWDYIKNKDPRTVEQARNFEITWMGQVPGKRESRRLVGPYMLRESDLTGCRLFDDQVAVGGWSIDLHPPGGFYSEKPGSKHLYPELPYSIPLRCTYSRNVHNLLVASRCISATHVAHGSTRLIATVACVGQASGTTAALCLERGKLPRDLDGGDVAELQQRLLRDDQFLLGVVNGDPADLARCATVTATSEHPCKFGDPDGHVPLYFPVAQRFYIPPHGDSGTLPRLRLYLRNTGDRAVTIRGGIRRDDGRSEFRAAVDLATFEAVVQPGPGGWVEVEFAAGAEPDFTRGGNFWIHVGEAEGVEWGQNSWHWPGFRRGYYNEDEERWFTVHPRQNQFFDPLFGFRGVMCFEVTGVPSPFPASAVNNGEHRPHLSPNLWVSGATRNQQSPVEVRVDFGRVVEVGEVWFRFDTDLDKPYPHQGYDLEREKDWPVPGKAPTCIRDLDLYAVDPNTGSRVKVHEVRGNYQRVVKVGFDAPVRTGELVAVPLANWGFDYFNIYEIRAY
ncbi:MAG: FAD-dependent oxidoreductase [Promethearchaeota archaeon]